LSFFCSPLEGAVLLLCDGGGEVDDDDDDEGAGEDGDDGAGEDDEEDEGGGVLGVLDVLEDVDDGGGVDDVVLSRWQPAAPNTSAMPSTSESLRFNIVRTSHLV
jgi:hypothetical protein